MLCVPLGSKRLVFCLLLSPLHLLSPLRLLLGTSRLLSLLRVLLDALPLRICQGLRLLRLVLCLRLRLLRLVLCLRLRPLPIGKVAIVRCLGLRSRLCSRRGCRVLLFEAPPCLLLVCLGPCQACCFCIAACTELCRLRARIICVEAIVEHESWLCRGRRSRNARVVPCLLCRTRDLRCHCVHL